MTLCRKFALLALFSVGALVWTRLDVHSNARTLSIGAPETECSMRNPLSPCAADLNVGYPIGDGLVFTPIEDFF
jgi:hypothetical protein